MSLSDVLLLRCQAVAVIQSFLVLYLGMHVSSIGPFEMMSVWPLDESPAVADTRYRASCATYLATRAVYNRGYLPRLELARPCVTVGAFYVKVDKATCDKTC